MRVLVSLLLGLAPGVAVAGDAKPIIAVFDIESHDAKIPARTLNNLSEYLAARLTASGQYEVIPNTEIKKRLQTQKADSYKSCFDQACQIEIGKELAAQKSLSTKVMRIAKQCVTTSTLFDLTRATTELAATAESACTEAGTMDAVKKIVEQLTVKPKSGDSTPKAASADDPLRIENWKIMGGTWEVKDGALYGKGGNIFWKEESSDGVLEFDAEYVSGPPALGIAGNWRMGLGRGYGLNFTHKGAYNLFVGDNDYWAVRTTNWKEAQNYKPSPLIKDLVNHVRIEFTGPKYKITMNGQVLEEGTDETHTSGRVGFWVQAAGPNEAPLVAKFQNIKITKAK